MTDTLVSHQVGITLRVGVIRMCENLYFGMGRWGGFWLDTKRGREDDKAALPRKKEKHILLTSI